MKDKIGFNIGFAIIAFPIGLGLLREFDFHNFVFRNPALGFIYLTTFIFSLFMTFKKKKDETEK
ncbi:hypothetical protein ABID42_001897 [Arcicella rosea]|uniref:hypothetical protein n=1 Tax=Arcicella rosea TaxID=502909 RepID=UPI00345CB749